MLTTTTSNIPIYKQTEDTPSVAALAGSLTGSVDGTIADVAAVTAAGGEATAAELTSVNTAITSINLQHKELQTKLNELIADLKSMKIIA